MSENIQHAEEHPEISVVGPGSRAGFGVLGIQSPFQGSSSLGKSCTAFLFGSGGVVLHWAVKLHQANLFLTCCGRPAGLSLTLRGYGWD